METMMSFLFLIIGFKSNIQQNKPTVKVEPVSVEYKGKIVKAKKLTVSSDIQMDIDSAWENVKTPKLLQFVAKGMIHFKSVEREFPKEWEVGQTYKAKMRIFGFIPFGGIHYLFIEKIDDSLYEISTKEWDKGAKIWNHHVVIKKLSDYHIHYEDSIIIYGGMMTVFITAFAKIFYKHRQKRWQIVAKENLKFGK